MCEGCHGCVRVFMGAREGCHGYVRVVMGM